MSPIVQVLAFLLIVGAWLALEWVARHAKEDE